MPLVSVVIAVRNGQEVVGRAVEAVCAQSLSDIELIVVNDGSTDGTQGVLERYAEADGRILIVPLDVNVGRARAKDIGLEKAKGKFAYFVDADDYISRTALESLCNVARRDKAELVYGGIREFDANSGEWLQYSHRNNIMSVDCRKTTLTESPHLARNPSILNCLFSMDMLDRGQIRFSKTRRNADDVTVSFYAAYHSRCISIQTSDVSYFYALGNFMNAVTEETMHDWRDQSADILRFATMYTARAVRNVMQIRMARNSQNLRRAERAFGNGDRLREFLGTLPILYRDFGEELLALLRPFDRRFAEFMLRGDIDGAFEAWSAFRSHENK